MINVYTKEVAKDIVDKFEDVLDEYDITVPDDDRTGDDGEARLYGMTYDQLLTDVECMIVELLKIARVSYTEDKWNGGKWTAIKN